MLLFIKPLLLISLDTDSRIRNFLLYTTNYGFLELNPERFCLYPFGGKWTSTKEMARGDFSERQVIEVVFTGCERQPASDPCPCEDGVLGLSALCNKQSRSMFSN